MQRTSGTRRATRLGRAGIRDRGRHNGQIRDQRRPQRRRGLEEQRRRLCIKQNATPRIQQVKVAATVPANLTR